ncbi:MAG: hypothetical protein HY243_09060 [Proteobacteria bacterium]|nr:hypothetical protein [Pseudomonadota bacterium]
MAQMAAQEGSELVTGLPLTDDTPLIRVDFTDAAAWGRVTEEVRRPTEDGYLASVHVFDDVTLAGRDPEELARIIAREGKHAICVFADGKTITHPDHPLLCIHLDTFASLRVIPSLLWSVENNLTLANMDFEEFTGSASDDGIFRGFYDATMP